MRDWLPVELTPALLLLGVRRVRPDIGVTGPANLVLSRLPSVGLGGRRMVPVPAAMD